jgi:hypothetical protein
MEGEAKKKDKKEGRLIMRGKKREVEKKGGEEFLEILTNQFRSCAADADLMMLVLTAAAAAAAALAPTAYHHSERI